MIHRVGWNVLVDTLPKLGKQISSKIWNSEIAPSPKNQPKKKSAEKAGGKSH